MPTSIDYALPIVDDEFVYFHSGDKASYRRVKKTERSKGSFTSIPTVDISNIDSPFLEDRKAIAKEIYEACTTSGFFYLSHHGLHDELLQRTFSTLHSFFDLDLDTKMSAHVQKNPAIRGYEPMLETRLDPRTKGISKRPSQWATVSWNPNRTTVA